MSEIEKRGVVLIGALVARSHFKRKQKTGTYHTSLVRITRNPSQIL